MIKKTVKNKNQHQDTKIFQTKIQKNFSRKIQIKNSIKFIDFRWLNFLTKEFKNKPLWWDLLNLVIIPITIFAVGIYINSVNRQQDLENNLDTQRETAFQEYMNTLNEVVVNKKDDGDKINKRNKEIIQTKTITTISRLDVKRKGILINSLSAINFLQGGENGEPTIDLSRLNLENIDISNIDLSGAILYGTRLNHAQIYNADLSNANLSAANLQCSDLDNSIMDDVNFLNSKLGYANMSGSNLVRANLQNADLQYADLDGAILYGANLRYAKLMGASFTNTYLRNAILYDTDLSGIDLESAVIEGAKYNINTKWSFGFDPSKAGAILVITN